MGREIITPEDVEDFQVQTRAGGTLAGGSKSKAPVADEYFDRLLKYIPAEIVALYLTLSSILLAAAGNPAKLPGAAPADNQLSAATVAGLYWAIFVILLAGTYLYQRYQLKVKKIWQLIISVGAFAVWVFALGGPFALLSWYHPVFGALLLPLYTAGVAFYTPKRK